MKNFIYSAVTNIRMALMNELDEVIKSIISGNSLQSL